jgi:HSP20 family protein
MAIIRRGERHPGFLEWDPLRMMRQLARFDPFADLEPVATLEPRVFSPAFDVRETKDAYIFQADLPGVREQDLEISLTGNRLTVSGKREEEERHEDERYFSYERSYGAFTRSFTLPEGCDPDRVTAQLKDGELLLTVPKRPEVQSKKIALTGAEARKEIGGAQKAKA